MTPTPAPTVPLPRWPPPLATGDLVALLAPAGPPDPDRVRRATERLRRWGLRTRLGAAVDAGHRLGFLAADDAVRAADFEGAFTDPEVAGVACLRGGWGSQRVLPHVDWSAVAAHPKRFVGFSDVTSLHVALQQHAGLATLHGPGPAWTGRALGRAGLASLHAALLGTPDAELRGVPLRPGSATGVLAGGNVTVLTALCGTPWQLDGRGAVVLLEDVDESPYRLDRALTQLRQAGALDGVVGLAVGALVECEGPDEHADAETVLADHAADLDVPAIASLPVGHAPGSHTLPLGVVTTVDGDAGRLCVRLPG